MDDPQPLGPDVEKILNEVLPEHVARERVRLLQMHADAVLEIRDRHRRAWEEMVGREVRVMVRDGLSPRVAEFAARNNLAVRKAKLDGELEAELTRLKDELRRKVQRLAEEEDERADRGSDSSAVWFTLPLRS